MFQKLQLVTANNKYYNKVKKCNIQSALCRRNNSD